MTNIFKKILSRIKKREESVDSETVTLSDKIPEEEKFTCKSCEKIWPIRKRKIIPWGDETNEYCLDCIHVMFQYEKLPNPED